MYFLSGQPCKANMEEPDSLDRQKLSLVKEKDEWEELKLAYAFKNHETEIYTGTS